MDYEVWLKFITTVRGLQQVQQLTNDLKQLTEKSEEARQALKRMGEISASMQRLQQYAQMFTQLNIASASLYYTGTRTFRGLARAVGWLVGPAIEMERYIQLMQSGKEATKEAMEAIAWATEFARKTPFELPQIIEATVILRTFGLDFKKWLKVAGDTAAKFGRTAPQAFRDLIRGIGRAATVGPGGIDLLREAGIVPRLEELKKYGWSGLSEDIKSFREALYRYLVEETEGAMERLSRTIPGVLSNIRDAIWFFRNEVGQILRPFLLTELRRFLRQLEIWRETGKMREWAQQIGEALLNIINGLKRLAEWFIRVLRPLARFLAHHRGFVVFAARVGVLGSAFAALAGAIGLAISPIGTFSTTLGVMILQIRMWRLQMQLATIATGKATLAVRCLTGALTALKIAIPILGALTFAFMAWQRNWFNFRIAGPAAVKQLILHLKVMVEQFRKVWVTFRLVKDLIIIGLKEIAAFIRHPIQALRDLHAFHKRFALERMEAWRRYYKDMQTISMREAQHFREMSRISQEYARATIAARAPEVKVIQQVLGLAGEAEFRVWVQQLRELYEKQPAQFEKVIKTLEKARGATPIVQLYREYQVFRTQRPVIETEVIQQVLPQRPGELELFAEAIGGWQRLGRALGMTDEQLRKMGNTASTASKAIQEYLQAQRTVGISKELAQLLYQYAPTPELKAEIEKTLTQGVDTFAEFLKAQPVRLALLWRSQSAKLKAALDELMSKWMEMAPKPEERQRIKEIQEAMEAAATGGIGIPGAITPAQVTPVEGKIALPPVYNYYLTQHFGRESVVIYTQELTPQQFVRYMEDLLKREIEWHK